MTSSDDGVRVERHCDLNSSTSELANLRREVAALSRALETRSVAPTPTVTVVPFAPALIAALAYAAWVAHTAFGWTP